MHELAITKSMLDLVLAEAEKAGAKKVGKISLVIGEMTGVVEDSVRFYFDFLSKGTRAEGAALTVTPVAIRAKCRDCDKPFEAREFNWICPHCDSNNLDIVSGKELSVESIEVD